jgi:hypothetical protein
VQIGEEKLERALRGAHTRERDQQQRLRWIAWVAGSYALDVLFLALFWAAGTVAGGVPLAYAAVGIAVCAATYAWTASGRNLKLRDPSLTMLQIGTAMLLQIGLVAAAPQLAFPILANLFTVFAFGMSWVRVRDAAVVWTLGAVALGGLFYAFG